MYGAGQSYICICRMRNTQTTRKNTNSATITAINTPHQHVHGRGTTHFPSFRSLGRRRRCQVTFYCSRRFEATTTQMRYIFFLSFSLSIFLASFLDSFNCTSLFLGVGRNFVRCFGTKVLKCSVRNRIR